MLQLNITEELSATRFPATKKPHQTIPGIREKNRHTRTCATADLVGSSEQKGTVARRKGRCPQMERSLCLSLFLCHRWTQSHLFLSHMPCSHITSVSVGARLTCLLSHKRGVLGISLLICVRLGCL